jgi:hypothetical protein
VDAQRPDDGIASTEILRVMIMTLESDMAVVSPCMPVGNESIHDGSDDDAKQESKDDFSKLSRVQTGGSTNAFQGFGEQAQRGSSEHEPCPEA